MAEIALETADPDSAEAKACIAAYFHELRERFDEGFEPSRSVSANRDELLPPAGVFLLARLDGRVVGCGALKFGADGFGEIKRMWVDASARGNGVARQLLAALEAQACAAGMECVRLDTHRALSEARAMYLRSGYVEIDAYNDNPYAHHWFEKRLAPRE